MDFRVFDLGLVDFQEAWQFQRKLFTDLKTGSSASTLILCQHHPVITLGRLTDKKNILASEQELKNKGIEVHRIERGGDVTYHGPGQFMAYPVFNLSHFKKDINWFLRQLEEVVIHFLSDFGIKAARYNGLTGVWVNRQKISSIGIAIKNWITFHGLSLNIKKDDLNNFNLIRPCGMDIEMTSLETILGREFEISKLKESFIQKFRIQYTTTKGSP
jgi:lipoate-protein ligase B